MRASRILTPVVLAPMILILVWQCSSATSGETKQDSTTMAIAVRDSVITETPAQPAAIVDNRTLKEKLDERFASIYPSGLDSAQHIKLVIQTTHNEYEGQTQGWYAELYFDRSFSPRLLRELHRYEYGVFPEEAGWYFSRAFTPEYYKEENNEPYWYSNPNRPDIKEYMISGDSIVSTREETSFYEDFKSGRSVIKWNSNEGGIKSSWSFDSTILLNVPVESDYQTEVAKDWSSNMRKLKRILKKGTVMDEDDDVLVVQLTESKESSDLMDSTNVIIPRVLYNQLKKSKQ